MVPIRFAILGAGRIGQIHAQALSGHENAVLAVVADPVEAAAQALSHRYGAQIREVEKMSTDDDVDAVVLCGFR